MGLFSFIKEAGEKLFGTGEAQAAVDSTAANDKAAAAIKKYIESMQLAAENLIVRFDGASTTVTVAGQAATQEMMEKILLSAGNVAGVSAVNNEMTVAEQAPAAQFHTVVRGDTLSAVAKKVYGNANKYNIIFEANRPMLAHPDKIYPGQVLRIPAL